MLSHQTRHQPFGVALAGVCRVRAHPADLTIPRYGEPLASHRDQFSVDTNPVIGAHFARALTEEAWESQRGKRDHRTGIFGGQQDRIHFVGADLDSRMQRTKHLVTVKRWSDTEPVRGLRLTTKDVNPLARRQ